MISKLLNSGAVQEDLNERSLTRLFNGLSIIAIIVTILCETYVCLFIDFFLWGFIVAISSIIIFSSVILLNAYKKRQLAKALVIIFINMSLIIVHFILGHKTFAPVIYISAFALYIAVFKQWNTILFFSLLTIIILISSIIFQQAPDYKPMITFTEDQVLPIKLLFIVAGSLLTLLISWFQKSNMQVHQISLEKTLEQKQTLIQEVHHRVKNNLQVIYSFLNLQKRRSSEEKLKSAIEANQNRIKSMVLVHEKLYESENLKYIKADEFLEELVEHLEVILSKDTQEVICHYNIQPVSLNLSQMIPIGLLVTEIITNSFKYAFRPGTVGEIWISLLESPDGIQLILKDNGKGIQQIDTKINTLGFVLIKNMASQLGAIHTTQSDGGFCHEFKFKKL